MAEDASGEFGVLGCGGSGSRLRGWAASQDQEESGGGAGWAGRALVAVNGAGRRRWPNRPETGKTAFPGRLQANGALGGRLELV